MKRSLLIPWPIKYLLLVFVFNKQIPIWLEKNRPCIIRNSQIMILPTNLFELINCWFRCQLYQFNTDLHASHNPSLLYVSCISRFLKVFQRNRHDICLFQFAIYFVHGQNKGAEHPRNEKPLNSSSFIYFTHTQSLGRGFSLTGSVVYIFIQGHFFWLRDLCVHLVSIRLRYYYLPL